ncbi:RHS repeat-associated core domain-containing protein, partial [Frateuria sp. GZRR35]|uniref:RHS repeat-associated core domain-containing protein n=1 Tax=Frateuria sp. GZRR35 TaxID=3351536 RepID=UPI003EDC0A6E
AWARVAAVVLTLLSLSLGGQAQAAETTTYVLTDVQGTVLAREDAQGTIIARYDYRPYGKQQAGPVAAGPGYTGHVEDPDTGLVYMQQRYYDPEVGRFLSVDPVTSGSEHFNRYWYASNNPIRNIDPTGLYTCDNSTKNGREFCGKIDTYVSHLRDSLKGLKFGSREYKAASNVIARVGEKGKSGPHYVPGSLKGKTVAQTNQRGTTTVDVSKISGRGGLDMAAGSLGHEAQHDIDAERWGVAGDTPDRDVAKKEFLRTESNAYKVQAILEKGLGGFINGGDLRSAIEASVMGDLSGWDSNHEN